MKTTEAIGTRVHIKCDDTAGVIVQNRATMPDLADRFDYVVRIDFADGPREWGYAASELGVL